MSLVVTREILNGSAFADENHAANFFQVIDDGTTSAGSKVVAVEIRLDQRCLIGSDRHVSKNIIAQILHGFSHTIHRKITRPRGELGCY
jgi:hypothetical protein